MDRFEKQPYEAFTISNDFIKNFGKREVISTQTVSAVNSSGVDATSTVTNQGTVANNGRSKVSVVVRAGTPDDSPYKLTFKCVTSNGHQWEKDILMIVEEL
jgi:hypothetical protein